MMKHELKNVNTPYLRHMHGQYEDTCHVMTTDLAHRSVPAPRQHVTARGHGAVWPARPAAASSWSARPSTQDCKVTEAVMMK